MKKIVALLFLFSALFATAFAQSTCATDPLYCKWLAYYNNKNAPEKFAPYNPIVLDPLRHPKLAPLQDMGNTLLGYVSLGEVTTTSAYFEQVQNENLLLAPNPTYPGSWYVDIRDPAWRNLMLQQVIPQILNKGFDGLYLDTLYIPLYLETVNPAAYRGMTKAAGDLVIAIRASYPQIPLMLGRAYQLLDRVGSYINFALGESVLSTYNFTTNLYEFVPLEMYQTQVNMLQDAKAKHPNLTLFTLDYWNPDDPVTIKKIYQMERINGFRPYVSAINLQKITPEP